MAVNWSAIAPLLTDRYRLLAPDLAGHGLTRSVGRGTTVSANRILLHRFLESMPGTPVILMGNSMGGLISLLEAANAPGAVSGLILISPVLPIVPARPDPAVTAMLMAYATPGLGQLLMVRRRRLSPEALVRSTMSLCCADPSRVPATVIAEHVAVARPRAAFTELNRDLGGGALRGLRGRLGPRAAVPPADAFDHGSRAAAARRAGPAGAGRRRPSRGAREPDVVGTAVTRCRPRAPAGSATDRRGGGTGLAGRQPLSDRPPLTTGPGTASPQPRSTGYAQLPPAWRGRPARRTRPGFPG